MSKLILKTMEECGIKEVPDGMFFCPICGELHQYFSGATYHYRDDDDNKHKTVRICEFCLGVKDGVDNVFRCYECEECFNANDFDGNYISSICEYVCDDCFEEYERCEGCNEYYHTDGMNLVDGNYYCDECYEEHCHNNEEEAIYEYSFKPSVVFHFANNETRLNRVTPVFGFELESGGLGCESDAIDAASYVRDIVDDNDDCEYYYMKSDCSIPGYGFELVTQPMSLAFHKQFSWENILKEMSSRGLRSHDLGDNECGLHVHVSKNYLTDTQWIICDWMLARIQDEACTIARRSCGRWASFGHEHMNPKPGTKHLKGHNKLFLEYGNRHNGTRYYALNFCNLNTVEFRIFRGTLKYSTLMASLEFCHAFVNVAKHAKAKDIIANSKDIWHGVILKYIVEHEEEYGDYLIPYLKTKHLA